MNRKKEMILAETILPFIRNGEKVLDLGCGSGEIAEYINQRREIKINLLDITRKYKKTDLKIELYDGGKIPYQDNSFDTVLVVFVLHHCENPNLTLEEAVRVSQNKVIVFKDTFETKLGFFLITVWHMAISFAVGEELFFTFIPDQVLKKRFKKLGSKTLATREIRLPFYKPIKQKLFVMTKKA